MASNLSKYVQINDFLLLEIEFNRDDKETLLNLDGIDLYLGTTVLGDKVFFNNNSIGKLNNDLELNSINISNNKSEWYINPEDIGQYYQLFSSLEEINQNSYQFDTIKVHIISGYNFNDLSGFLLEVQALDSSDNFINLSNFTWINQILGDSVLKFNKNTLYLANKFYDKYLEFKIPSISYLGGQDVQPIEQILNIKELSNIYFNFSIIEDIYDNKFIIDNKIELELPIVSQADNFNAFIAESTAGDYIEFYATWKDRIIGEYMGDIESGRIPLYTSNNPGDNYEEFSNIYGTNNNKWVIMHEIYLYEHIPGNTLLTQQYVFTQDNNFNLPNYFRPVIKYADIASSFTIDYICRLTNRMDGTQIIRKASFGSTNPKKYGKELEKINLDNLVKLNVFNRVESDHNVTINNNENNSTKIIKTYYNNTNILLSQDNQALPQGQGTLFLFENKHNYKFTLNVLLPGLNNQNRIKPLDLSGSYRYFLTFTLDNDKILEIETTYSANTNMILGQLEFIITKSQAKLLLKQKNNIYSIVQKYNNLENSTIFQGLYYPYSNKDIVLNSYNDYLSNLNNIQLEELQKENEELRRQLNNLNTTK